MRPGGVKELLGLDLTCDCCGLPSDVHTPVDRLLAAVRAVQKAGPPNDEREAAWQAEALLQAEQALRAVNLQRLGDVAARGLNDFTGDRSAAALARRTRPDGDPTDASLAAALVRHPRLRESVESGRLSLLAARRAGAALGKVLPHVDAGDRQIDGYDGDEVVRAVVGNVAGLVCRHLGGLHDDDPRLAAVLRRAAEVMAVEGTQAERLEAAFAWLAEDVQGPSLVGMLDELVCAVVPSILEERGEAAHRRRALSLTPDGDGWHLCGQLDLECGERLWTALRALASRDHRGDDERRTKGERLHDAFSVLTEHFLSSGDAGSFAKVPVQVSVVVRETTLGDHEAAEAPRADSGRLVPRSLVRRWWCDASVTSFVLSLGGKALRAVHAQRNLRGVERKALALENGGTCIGAGSGCCPGRPDPLRRLLPHHVLGYAESGITSLDEVVLVCEALHHDLHSGKRVVRLRDGRFLAEDGFRHGPGAPPPPPF